MNIFPQNRLKIEGIPIGDIFERLLLKGIAAVNMPIQLYALTWSQDDSTAIQQWQQQHGDNVFIAGWSRILLEPLDKAVQDPNIMGLAIDGVVIRDHSHWPENVLQEAIKRLAKQTLKLYSVHNGLEPVVTPMPAR